MRDKSKEIYNNITPIHYMFGNYELTKDILRQDLTEQEYKGFHKLYILKYVMRASSKNGLEDYKKAEWYLNNLIDYMAKDITVDDDKINPSYYANDAISLYDLVEDQFSPEEVEGAYKGTIIRYILRSDHKNGLEDYVKARQFLKQLIKYKEKDAIDK